MALQRARIAGLVLVAVLAGACGGGDDDGGNGGGGAGAGGGGFSISAPEDGAEVASSFNLEISSDEELGPRDTGAHHVHVFYDGNSDDYEVVEATSFKVSGLEPGEHTVTASLRNADHSPAGAEAEITVMVASGGGGGGGGGGDGGSGDDDYNY